MFNEQPKLRLKTPPTPEILRMYKTFKNRGIGEHDTLTVVVSDSNQCYSTWTTTKPSKALLLTIGKTTKWNLEPKMNLHPDGGRMTISEFEQELRRLGYRYVFNPLARERRKINLPPVPKPVKGPNPLAWSSLEKFKKVYGLDFKK